MDWSDAGSIADLLMSATSELSQLMERKAEAVRALREIERVYEEAVNEISADIAINKLLPIAVSSKAYGPALEDAVTKRLDPHLRKSYIQAQDALQDIELRIEQVAKMRSSLLAVANLRAAELNMIASENSISSLGGK